MFKSFKGRPGAVVEARGEFIGERHAAAIGAGSAESKQSPATVVDLASARGLGDALMTRHIVSDAKEALALCAGCATCAPTPKSYDAMHDSPAQTSIVPAQTNDEPTLTVTVGGSVSGMIDADGDVDTITVNLVAGQTYSFSLTGTGANPVSDTFLSLFAPGGALIVEDDDGGNGTFSFITITATVTGTYTLTAESFSNPGDPGLGEWTLNVRQQGADAQPATPPSAAVATVGASTYGFIETAGDVDVYQVTLTGGFVYNFAVAGGADYNTNYASVPGGELDTIIRIYDAAGNLVYTNDDIVTGQPPAFSDISSSVGFVADVTGTYYVEIDAYNAQTGGYVLDIEEIDPATLDPLDSIDWGTQLPSTVVTVYFAQAGEVFDGVTSLGWNAYEIQQAMAALNTYSQFSNLTFSQTTTSAGATFHLVTTNSTEFLGYFNPPGEVNEGVGVFARDGTGWEETNVNGGLQQGGYGWITMIHEFGHGLGMAHPHDNGGTSEVMPGVSGPFGSYGIFDLNQGVYTTMSYNDGWQLHPDVDANGFPVPDTLNYGYQGTPMAFDIALIQEKYGAVAHNVTNTTYTLGNSNTPGTYYQAIWDTGGTDEIVYAGTRDAVIDLTAATLDYSATGGGVISWVDGIFGGFTIANGVVIENAAGGSGSDLLIGNAAANVLTGNGGNDVFIGRDGNDSIAGGAGLDTAIFRGNIADYTITAIAGGYTVVDNNLADGNDGTDTVTDVEYLQFANGLFVNDIDPANDVPSIAGLTPTLTFNENVVNATPQLIDGDVDFQDDDSNFTGGTLTVSGLLAEDRVAIRDQGDGIGQIGVDGNNVTYNGFVIGTFTGGNGTALTVTFTASASSLAVDALIQNLTYANVSQDPTLTRTLTLNVVDAAGANLAAVPTLVHSFTERTGANDPLANPPLPTFGANPNPGFVDVDADGDLDMVMGDVAGTFRYFQRTGSTYTEITGAANPFNGLDVGSYSNPEAIDIDGDGDMDLVSGAGGGIVANNGTIFTVRNNGGGSWTQLTGAANPFNGIDVGGSSDVAAVDVNGDGRMDLVVGNQAGTIDVFIHNADHTFTQQVGAANPFNGIDIGSYSSPAGIDVDGDGDTDVLLGNNAGTVRTFLNNGSGAFTEATGTANPFNGLDVGSFSNLSATDLDGDGDRDLVIGDLSGGDTRVFDHVVTNSATTNITVTVNAQNDAPSGTDNAFVLPAGGSHTFTAAEFGFSDIDADNFLAVVINTLPTQGALRLNGVAVTAGQVITVANINAGQLTFTADPNESGPHYGDFTFSVRDDGGTANGGLNTDTTPNLMNLAVLPANSPPRLSGLATSVTFAENTVNATPQLLDPDVNFTDPDNNFNGGTVTVSGALAQDVLGVNNEGNGAGQIGVTGNTVSYGGVTIGTIAGGNGSTLTITLNGAATSEAVDALLENLTYANTSDQPTGARTLTINVTDAAGADLAFQSVFGVFDDDPMAGLTNGGSYSTPTFLDVDGDGDLDMVSGGNTGAIFLYENDNGTFAEAPGSANPFNGIDLGAFTSTAAINIDTDGDLDLVVGRSDGTLVAFRNNGNGTFTQLAGAASPFNGVDVGDYSAPTGGDIDGDGDMDLVVGNLSGTLSTFVNNGNGTFTQLTGAANPFAGIDVGLLASPSLFDLDGDGDLDALVSNYYGDILAFNNGGAFTTADPSQNPFDGLFVGASTVFGFADLDGDGDLDAVAGSSYGDFIGIENISPSSASIVVNVTPQADRVQLFDQNGVLVQTYNDIQDAIDAASDGYRIVAAAGTYTENLLIDVDVTIEGANAGTAGNGVRVAETIIDGQVVVAADGVTINGVSVTGAGPGPLGDSGVVVNSGSDNFSLVNSVLDQPEGTFGIFVGLVTGLDVGNNLIQGSTIGMYITGGNTTGSVHDNLFQGEGGPFTGLGNGVNSETSLVLIQNNTFDGIYANSLNLFPFGPDPLDLNSYVIGNVFTDSGAERPISIYPTSLTANILGTDENEAFNGDIGGQAPGTPVSFDGRGGNDDIYGAATGDTLIGGSGNDRIFAGDGDDQLNGGADNDEILGEGGNDTLLFNVATGGSDTVNLGAGNDVVLTSGIAGEIRLTFRSSEVGNGDPLDSVNGNLNVSLQAENLGSLTGPVSRFDDEGITFVAAAGQTFDVRDISGTQRGTQFEVVALGTSAGDLMFASNPARPYYFNGGMGDDIIIGGNANDFLVGGNGNDFLDGGNGNDSFIGGANNDTIFGRDGNDIVIFDVATGGSDTIDLGVGVDVVNTSGITGQIRLTFTSAEVGNDNPFDSVAGGLNVRLQAEDGTGALTGPVSRIDDEGITFVAAAGQTFDVRDTGGAQRGDQFRVVALGTAAADLMTASFDGQSYYFNAGMGDDTVVGGTVDDFLVGGAGNDLLVAGRGNDTILGGAGNDTIYGEGGSDTASGGTGDDVYIVDSTADVTIEAANEGNDAVLTQVSYILTSGASVELLAAATQAGTEALELSGNFGNQTIVGNYGNNVLTGGVGADTLIGLLGDDVYIVNDAQAQVVEDANGGNDTLFVTTSYALGLNASVETISTSFQGGTAAINIAGSNTAQTIFGNFGDNVIDGKGGNDTLVGFGGTDTFAFTSALGAGNVDAIADFSVADDTIALDDAVFTGIGGLGTLSSGAFVTGTTAGDADDRIIYNSATGELFYDADGNGAGAAVLFATVTPGLALTANDFTVI